ncbi:Pectinesterase [Handroanthus impetiginosus]|uniref:Pectinesterase n=1 Tax=Handroanthus impetiginosus TaxID=429701 RepID=A0A2G9GGL9_9LAMI|nr:Pectinesterase [Handroanthus impetiginosus]
MSKFTLYSSLVFLLSVLFLQYSSADTPPSNPVPPSTVCKSTPYPSFCNNILPSNTSSSNIYDYGRFSIHKSLSSAQKFLSLIEKYLGKSKTLTITAIRALEDCKFLAQSNIDYLISSSQIITRTSQTLPLSQADDVQTFLSAILTNAQTCIDGLQATASAWSVRNGILTPISNDTRLYSVSLALFTKGWVPKNRKKKPLINQRHNQLKLTNGSLNLKMSEKNKVFYEKLNNRRLLQVNKNGDNKILVSGIVIVSQDGSGNFSSINDAVAVAPNNTDGTNGYFLIHISAGVYEEYVSIPKNKKYLMMVGDGINQTIITGNHSVVDGWTTFNSSTFGKNLVLFHNRLSPTNLNRCICAYFLSFPAAVVGTGFLAVGITFRNTAGPIKHQAVAVRNGADLSTFYLCSFEAYQDTLYVHSLRQFYLECDIYGTVDFIFGNAAVVFQDCNLYPRLPMSNQFNAITAQGRTDPNQNTGISIHNCTIRAGDDLANSNLTIQTYLGRPWKEYSRTVYMQSFMDSSINPSGWSIWSGDFALSTLYYAEFDNTGPGSDTSRRVTWPGYHVINATDAANFTVSAFLAGDAWIPQTRVPYTSGLL